MKYIQQFYGGERLKMLNDKRLAMEVQQGVAYFLTADDVGARLRQQEFDNMLEMVYRHNIADKDLINRLNSESWTEFFQTYRELMVAYYFESYLGHSIAFHPPGEGNHILDFKVIDNNETLFVEVKSPVKESMQRVWFGNDEKNIRKVFKDASKQFQQGQMNLLVIAGALRIPIRFEKDVGLFQAIYGEEVLKFEVSEEGLQSKPRLEFVRTGKYQENLNTRISAVASFEDVVTDSLRYSFKLFHNPFASFPIPEDYFQGVVQFVKRGDHMVWNTGESDGS